MSEIDVARSVGRMYTAAIEEAASSNAFGGSSSSGERNRRRHEAVVQFMLAHIIKLDGELRSFAKEFGLAETEGLHVYQEAPDPGSKSRFDHVIDAPDGTPIAVIEDKIDAALGPRQLDRYAEYLSESDKNSDLIVFHPARRDVSASVKVPTGKKVRIRFISWYELSTRMAKRAGTPEHAALWEELAEFAESIGTGDLTSLPSTAALLDRGAALEVRDVLLTGQKVAHTLARGKLKEMSFSMHPGNPHSWLQAGLTDIKHLRVGVELDVRYVPGDLYLGVRGPGQDLDWVPAKIGFFPNGELTKAGHRRVAMLAEIAEAVEKGDTKWPPHIPGRPVGRLPSEEAMDSLQTLAAVFQASSLRNPHRGGATDGARKSNEGEFGERLGVRLQNAGNTIELFIGPPIRKEWIRSSIWIRTPHCEYEIKQLAKETGRDYVLRVWDEVSKALETELGA